MKYQIRFENKSGKITKRKLASEHLYDAAISIAEYGGLIFKNGQLVAFYCSHENKVKAGFGANEYEKRDIKNFNIRGK